MTTSDELPLTSAKPSVVVFDALCLSLLLWVFYHLHSIKSDDSEKGITFLKMVKNNKEENTKMPYTPQRSEEETLTR